MKTKKAPQGTTAKTVAATPAPAAPLPEQPQAVRLLDLDELLKGADIARRRGFDSPSSYFKHLLRTGIAGDLGTPAKNIPAIFLKRLEEEAERRGTDSGALLIQLLDEEENRSTCDMRQVILSIPADAYEGISKKALRENLTPTRYLESHLDTLGQVADVVPLLMPLIFDCVTQAFNIRAKDRKAIASLMKRLKREDAAAKGKGGAQ